VPQELYFRLLKLTLGEFDFEVVVTQNLHDSAQVFPMLCMGLAEHKNVIYVDHHKLVEERPEDVIHGSLESCGCIGQPEAQDFELIMTKRRSESRFGAILGRNANLMVPRLQVQA